MKTENNEDIKNKPQSFVLKSIFDKYAEEIITDEQIERLLKPILQMIKDGRFDKTHSTVRVRRFYRAILSVAAVVALMLTVVFTQIKGKNTTTIVIADTKVPLSSFQITNSISGNVIMNNKGVEGVVIVLESIDESSQPVSTTDVNGEYVIKGFSNGVYFMKVILPEGIVFENGNSEGYVEINGLKELEFNNSNILDIEIVVEMRK